MIYAIRNVLEAVLRGRNPGSSDRGASTIETVVIAAGFALLAIALVAGITLLVNNKLGGISL